MDPNQIQKTIATLIHKVDPSAEAFLFGSRARSEHHQNSDWDILILVEEEKVTNDIEDKFRNELYDLELETGEIISIFIYPKLFWNNVLVHTPLFHEVQDEGVKL